MTTHPTAGQIEALVAMTSKMASRLAERIEASSRYELRSVQSIAAIIDAELQPVREGLESIAAGRIPGAHLDRLLAMQDKAAFQEGLATWLQERARFVLSDLQVKL